MCWLCDSEQWAVISWLKRCFTPVTKPMVPVRRRLTWRPRLIVVHRSLHCGSQYQLIQSLITASTSLWFVCVLISMFVVHFSVVTLWRSVLMVLLLLSLCSFHICYCRKRWTCRRRKWKCWKATMMTGSGTSSVMRSDQRSLVVNYCNASCLCYQTCSCKKSLGYVTATEMLHKSRLSCRGSNMLYKWITVCFSNFCCQFVKTINQLQGPEFGGKTMG